MSDLWSGMFGEPPSGGDWLAALLTVESALARANAATGRIPAESAKLIEAACRPELFDEADLALRTAENATPVPPLVADLRALVPAEAREHVHRPATSQDVLDTALMLLVARAVDAAAPDLDACAVALDRLAAEHAGTPQLARTLLAAALPSTFGRLADTWRGGLAEARAALDRVRADRLAVQLGGAVGDLDDPALVAAFAAEVGLPAPRKPWHTNRIRVGELAAALGLVAGALAKVAGDVLLLAQAEVAEVEEGSPGGSSAMPGKRNSARAVQVVACAHRVPGLVATVFAGLPQELQRAAGRWQAEWQTVGELLALTGAAARHARAMLTGLRVDTDRMGERA
jgi:3-carboxy-cis,cis-muconate cycloisomerase